MKQPRRERRERDEEDVREADPQHRHRERELVRVPGEARGDQVDQDGRGDHADHGDDEEREREDAHDSRGEEPRRVLALFLAPLAQHRDEGLRERALGEEAPQQVGDAERDEERVRRGAGAEVDRDQGVAQEPGDPRQQGHAAHRRRHPQQIHRRGLAPAKPGGLSRALFCMDKRCMIAGFVLHP
jgi:hypothetical protein